MYTIESAHSPHRINDTQITLWVKFHQFNEELPFTADQNDTEEHGRLIYENAAKGDYGSIE